jgi:hypothetical protein
VSDEESIAENHQQTATSSEVLSSGPDAGDQKTDDQVVIHGNNYYFTQKSGHVGQYVSGRDVMTWVGAAIASGIVGNMAWDVVKAAFADLKVKIPKFAALERSLDNNHKLIAKLAVQARCAEIDRLVPRFEDLKAVAVVNTSDHYDLKVTGPNLQATVLIPRGKLEESRLHVTLTTLD